MNKTETYSGLIFNNDGNIQFYLIPNSEITNEIYDLLCEASGKTILDPHNNNRGMNFLNNVTLSDDEYKYGEFEKYACIFYKYLCNDFPDRPIIGKKIMNI